MSLIPGTRLGPYEITGAIGAGGMGEVFRARDTKLNRDVAIKVLPAAFADDPERLARFTREAQTLASLNHPNIATIHGIEELPAANGSGAGSRALVMELVEGEDLSTHMARGPIPVAEALPIARQIAEALEAAHEQGIVHRDLKPANIKVRSDGTVKVLDFGLAKAMDPAGASSSNPNVSHSPTLTHQGTSAGMIIGTAAYMAPEQAKGKAVDKRADIWAFGVVLYEMLSGKRAFKGEDVSETLAAVLMTSPSMDAVPATTPPRLKRLIERCLDRDLKSRLRDIGEARVKIARIETGAPDTTSSATPASAAAPGNSSRLPWALAAALLIVVLGGLSAWAPWRTPAPQTPRTLLAAIGAEASMFTTTGAQAVLSPDGKTLVFAARPAAQPPQLFVRKLDQLQATPIAGTEGAYTPFFSPDGKWVAFFAGDKLKKISVTGGAAIALCDVVQARGGTWAEDDTIIFTPNTGPGIRLMRVSAAGGTPAVFGQFGQGATTQRWPQAIPGGKAVLYTENNVASSFDASSLVVAPLDGGPPKVIMRGGYHGRYVASGHILFMANGTLFAAPFSLDRLETTGPAAPAFEGVSANPGLGGASFSASDEGSLIFVPGAAVTPTQPLNWITRDGKTSVLRDPKAVWRSPRFSPDGQRLAMNIGDSKQQDIWVYEWAHDTMTQLTFDPANDQEPAWSPDGKHIVFESDRAQAGVFNLYIIKADGSGKPRRLTDSPNVQSSGSWHPSGKWLAYAETRPGAREDLMALPMTRTGPDVWTPGTPEVLLSTPSSESLPMFSPDGRFLAYVVREPGSANVFVRPFPDTGGTWRVSSEGGTFPVWSLTSPELLFVSPDQGLVMAATYSVSGGSFRTERPRPWLPAGVSIAFPGGNSTGFGTYALHPDGKRIAARAVAATGGAGQDKVVFVSNLFDYLRAIAPVKK